MRIRFCKNSVFCILFLFYFTLGTICGIFLFRCAWKSDPAWIVRYCLHIQNSSSRVSALSVLFHLVPVLGAIVIRLLPGSSRLLAVLIIARGCICAYALSAFYATNTAIGAVVARNLLLLPAFYAACRIDCCKHQT